jgi:hypothetical protein
MSLITFVREDSPAASFSPTHNPNYAGSTRTDRNIQPRGWDTDGNLYAYNHGAGIERVVSWNELPDADLTNLIQFYETVRGGRHKFTFTDEDGTVYEGVTIVDNSLKYVHVGNGRNEASLEMVIE